MISVGEAYIVVFLSSGNLPTLFTIFISLGFTNVTAIAGAWQLELYRKRNYADHVKSIELQRSLEQHSKHLEELVTERTEKLKAAERLATIGATAGMVGHDIRNPLTVITGAVYLSKIELKKLPANESIEKLKSNLDLIDDQIIYVNKIVFDLQEYAMPLQPNWEKVDLEQMVQSIVLSLKIPSNIAVDFTISKEAADLRTDSAYIKRILTNLINNAAQAMSNGGQLTVTASSENGKIVIDVQDTGEGIPEDAKDKLFTPLFTTKAKGQGFGLAVVKRLTEGLGGTVTFDSEVCKGTKFTIILPQ
jgi:signal transduction histidine kinase